MLATEIGRAVAGQRIRFYEGALIEQLRHAGAGGRLAFSQRRAGLGELSVQVLDLAGGGFQVSHRPPPY